MDWTRLHPLGVFGRYYAQNVPVVNNMLKNVGRNGQKLSARCQWHFHKNPMRALEAPDPKERAARFSLRMFMGGIGTLSGVYLASNAIQTDRPYQTIAGLILGTSAFTQGIAKTTVALDKSRLLNDAAERSAEKRSEAQQFLVQTVEFSLARRAIAGAEVLAHAQWKDLSLAIDIAEYCMKNLRELEKRTDHRNIADRRIAARKISELTSSVDVTHDHYDLLLAIEKTVYPESSFGNRR